MENMYDIKIVKGEYGFNKAELIKSDGPDIGKLLINNLDLFHSEGIEEVDLYEVIADFLGKEKHPAFYLAELIEKEYVTFKEKKGKVTYFANKDKLYPKE